MQKAVSEFAHIAGYSSKTQAIRHKRGNPVNLLSLHPLRQNGSIINGLYNKCLGLTNRACEKGVKK
jgi:hypothetical protein